MAIKDCCGEHAGAPRLPGTPGVNRSFTSLGSTSAVGDWPASTSSQSTRHLAALSGVTALLHHHAAVHRALQMPEHGSLIDAAAYLRKLCVAISRSQLEPRKINLVLAPQPLRLEAERCWRIGLIVYELVINAAWHAFPRGDGEVRLELLRTGPVCRMSCIGQRIVSARNSAGTRPQDRR